MEIRGITQLKFDIRSESNNHIHICYKDTVIASIPFDDNNELDLTKEAALNIANHIVQLPNLINIANGLNNWSIRGGTFLAKPEKQAKETLKELNYI